MSAVRYFHGGVPGLTIGDILKPSPPHAEDGCPICEAKRLGLACTVGQYRSWLRQFGARAAPVLAQLAGAPNDEVIDPPSAKAAVYITSDLDYATWYAARSGNGDLYEVVPVDAFEPSMEDPFPSWTCRAARVVRVVRRGVHLTRTDRRRISHRWKKADARKARRAAA